MGKLVPICRNMGKLLKKVRNRINQESWEINPTKHAFDTFILAAVVFAIKISVKIFLKTDVFPSCVILVVKLNWP